ncbi:uncharacterized protein BP5553_06020 [Venustampulla echinocandica]|uniref:Origin recognition complex subunit 3 n=1 Tax=Venustampulla echinocandica TaxID=2656787 RepID=A0A370TMC3_9HELO|nr:uncharacterized protein BP5553_06020 [Venustampulla echinocandica]RDL36668.1 hypothetical protein BP5553_06020 [Venustampulla echinocandica]
MSDNAEANSHAGFDSIDHQPAYIYTPDTSTDDAPERPTKRRRVTKPKQPGIQTHGKPSLLRFEPLLGGLESEESARWRQETFQKCWGFGRLAKQEQSILDESNEDTLAEVSSFVNSSRENWGDERLPACFIVTGPNIASQDLLFRQVSVRLKSDIDGPVVILRSGDAANLKAILKKLIRDATNQRSDDDDMLAELNDRKLLYYDLEILRSFVTAHGSQRVVVAIQDSEGFETNLLVELIILLRSWMDRIPFVLLFGIATSVELFRERLPRSASRSLYGAQVDVEQTNSIIERVFQKAVASSKAYLRLGPALVSMLVERQHHHIPSVQSFIAALKYAYMSHFYGNPLSFLGNTSSNSLEYIGQLQPCHYEAIRMLPSFRRSVVERIEVRDINGARELLEDDAILAQNIKTELHSKDGKILCLLRALHILESATTDGPGGIDLYLTVFGGALKDSDFFRRLLDSLERMTPEDLISLTEKIRAAIKHGNSAMDLDGWAEADQEFLQDIKLIETKVKTLTATAVEKGVPIRSSESIHSKGLRTTVIAQRVQLSYQKSTISEAEKEYQGLVGRLLELFEEYFTLENPQHLFLNEVWLCNSTTPFADVFVPRPRAAIEHALSSPQEYLSGIDQNLPPTQPETAILYQKYLEAPSLINVADLWSSFLETVAGGEAEESDERGPLMQFYRGMADLNLLGMVKQSKKKADHLAKVSWKGL